MNDPTLRTTIDELPKIELHRHLEGAVRLTTLVSVAKQYRVEMPEYEVETLRPFVQMMPGEHRSMQNFLAKFKTIRQFFLSHEVIQRVAREAVIDAAQDNIKYMELRFTPVALCAASKCKINDVVGLVCEAVREACDGLDIDVRLIVSMNRHESLAIGREVLRAAIAHRDKGVVAVDLAGRESNFPASLFRDLFTRAIEEGLFVTIHAGEWEGAQSVWDAVGNLSAHRIGHGVRAMEDKGVVEILQQKSTVLEVCPTSNVHSGIFADLATHPLPQMVEQGLKITINTDDPLISGITLGDEMAYTVEHMPVTVNDLKRYTLNAAEAAFLQESERNQLVEKFKRLLNIS